MTVLDVMKRVGSTETNLIIHYIKEAISEIQSRTSDNVQEDTISIVANQREYDISSMNIKRLLSVWMKDDNGDYVRCSQAKEPSIEEA